MFSQKTLGNLCVSIISCLELFVAINLCLTINAYASFGLDKEIRSIHNISLLGLGLPPSDASGQLHTGFLYPPDDHPPYPFLPGVSSKTLFNFPTWQFDLIYALVWIRHQLNSLDFESERRIEILDKVFNNFFWGSRETSSSTLIANHDSDHLVNPKKQFANIQPEILPLYPVTHYEKSGSTKTKDAPWKSLGECPLCEMKMDNKEELFCAIGCEHIFHSHCLFRWFAAQERIGRRTSESEESPPCCRKKDTRRHSCRRILSASMNLSEFAKLTSQALNHAKRLIQEKSGASIDAVDRNSDIRTYLRMAELSLNDDISYEAAAILMSLEQQSDEPAGQRGGSYITNAVQAYVNTGDTNVLLPLVRNPPGWQEVHEVLLNYYQEKKTKYPYADIRKTSPLFKVFGQFPHFMTQIPTRETILGIVNVIRYFKSELHRNLPEQNLVIAGIGSGNCIIERALLEYFKQSQELSELPIVQNRFIELQPGLFLHCSDEHTRPGSLCSYTSNPMLACEQMDYKAAITSISEALPNAYILPFASWFPKESWFEALVSDPSVIGSISLRDPRACNGWQDLSISRNPDQQSRPNPEGWPPLMTPNQEFWCSDFNIRAWGANDQLKEVFSDNLNLWTKLSIYYPKGLFNAPKLSAELLYDDTFLEQKYRPVDLPEYSDSDSD